MCSTRAYSSDRGRFCDRTYYFCCGKDLVCVGSISYGWPRKSTAKYHYGLARRGYCNLDKATISFSVVGEAKQVVDAQKQATDISNRAIAFLKDKGIAEKDIKTTNYSIYPRYEYLTDTLLKAGTVPVSESLWAMK